MNYKFLKVYGKSQHPFDFSNKQNRPVFQRVGVRKHIFVEEVEQAFEVTKKMDLKATVQYFNMLGVDYIRACKYCETVSQLEKNFRIMIEEP